MSTNEKKEKSLVKYLLIFITLILVVLLAGLAYAKYQTAIKGGTNAQIAEWHFDLQNCEGKSATVKGINFPMTRTDNNKSVADNKLAPGTSGEFKMIVDTTNTQVLALYNIKINLTDCPTNLKFYIDSDMKQELEKVKISENEINNETIIVHQISISRFLPLSIVNDKHTETLYWQWPMETGNTEQDKYKNNLEDSKWIGKEKMTMDISAIGEQVLEAPSQIAIRSINVENSNGSTSTATINKEATGIADGINTNIVLGSDSSSTSTINVSMTNLSGDTYYFYQTKLLSTVGEEINSDSIDYEIVGLKETKGSMFGTMFVPGSTLNFDVVFKYKNENIPNNDNSLLDATLNFKYVVAIVPTEYIKSNGNQYIEFDYKAKVNTKIELDIELSENEKTNNYNEEDGKNIIGRANMNDKYTFTCNFGALTSQNTVIFYWLDKIYEPGNEVYCYTYLETITERSLLIMQSGSVQFQNCTITAEQKTTNNISNMVLLGTYNAAYNKILPLKIYDSKIYSFKIYEDDNLIKNLIPCYTLGDGIAGLYDLVDGEFYSSNSNTDFSK